MTIRFPLKVRIKGKATRTFTDVTSLNRYLRQNNVPVRVKRR
jgi:hypothetical protein